MKLTENQEYLLKQVLNSGFEQQLNLTKDAVSIYTQDNLLDTAKKFEQDILDLEYIRRNTHILIKTE